MHSHEFSGGEDRPEVVILTKESFEKRTAEIVRHCVQALVQVGINLFQSF